MGMTLLLADIWTVWRGNGGMTLLLADIWTVLIWFMVATNHGYFRQLMLHFNESTFLLLLQLQQVLSEYLAMGKASETGIGPSMSDVGLVISRQP